MLLLALNRWKLAAALLISSALWLVVSSVTANAVHSFAKNDFILQSLGSISIVLAVTSLAWTVFASCTFLTGIKIGLRKQFLALCFVAIWVGMLIVISAVSDQILGDMGMAAMAVWIVEFVFAVLLISYFYSHSLPFAGSHKRVFSMVIAFTWLAALKTVFLCLSPGILIKL
jgi:hypothetical protein